MNLNTSVICAVWHQDPDRLTLLRSHRANLAAQSVPVEPIYVFDGYDQPPSDISATVIIAQESLTIYEAWNLALLRVKTPYVMNLNLDDRLAPDAIAQLEAQIQQGADLVGGDWQICYNQHDTDAVKPCYPSSDLPFVDTWPPSPGTLTRLGSGTRDRGTLGPATLWSMALHTELPRYPWKFTDGSLIKTIGDLVWWRLVEQVGGKIVRYPTIIGHYHSHPQTQAEFRNPDKTELEKLFELGIALF
jgi:hypothetical protein